MFHFPFVVLLNVLSIVNVLSIGATIRDEVCPKATRGHTLARVFAEFELQKLRSRKTYVTGEKSTEIEHLHRLNMHAVIS